MKAYLYKILTGNWSSGLNLMELRVEGRRLISDQTLIIRVRLNLDRVTKSAHPYVAHPDDAYNVQAMKMVDSQCMVEIKVEQEEVVEKVKKRAQPKTEKKPPPAKELAPTKTVPQVRTVDLSLVSKALARMKQTPVTEEIRARRRAAITVAENGPTCLDDVIVTTSGPTVPTF